MNFRSGLSFRRSPNTRLFSCIHRRISSTLDLIVLLLTMTQPAKIFEMSRKLNV